jgi:hypothetical protein
MDRNTQNNNEDTTTMGYDTDMDSEDYSIAE